MRNAQRCSSPSYGKVRRLTNRTFIWKSRRHCGAMERRRLARPQDAARLLRLSRRKAGADAVRHVDCAKFSALRVRWRLSGGRRLIEIGHLCLERTLESRAGLATAAIGI